MQASTIHNAWMWYIELMVNESLVLLGMALAVIAFMLVAMPMAYNSARAHRLVKGTLLPRISTMFCIMLVAFVASNVFFGALLLLSQMLVVL